MDFIEKLFGISPDGGDGSTELIIVAVIVIVAIVARSRSHVGAWRRQRRPPDATRTGERPRARGAAHLES